MSRSATRRRPIRGAAGRPLKPSDYWLDESRVRHSVHTEKRSYSESFTRGVGAAHCPSPAAGKNPTWRGALCLLLKLALVVALCGSLYLAYKHQGAADLQGLLGGVAVALRDVARNATAYLGLGDESKV